MDQDINVLMDVLIGLFNPPDEAWLLSLEYSVELSDHLRLKMLYDLPPISVGFGGVTNTSPFLCLHN